MTTAPITTTCCSTGPYAHTADEVVDMNSVDFSRHLVMAAFDRTGERAFAIRTAAKSRPNTVDLSQKALSSLYLSRIIRKDPDDFWSQEDDADYRLGFIDALGRMNKAEELHARGISYTSESAYRDWIPPAAKAKAKATAEECFSAIDSSCTSSLSGLAMLTLGLGLAGVGAVIHKYC